jgi:hypothetical protein
LHKIRRDTVLTPEPSFTLKTRLNTSLKRQRVPGTYEMHVYLDRRLLLKGQFTLEAPLVPEEPET